MSSEEFKLITHVVSLCEKLGSFSKAQRGCLNNSYGLPYVIPVVDHKPWQKHPVPIPCARQDEFTDIFGRDCAKVSTSSLLLVATHLSSASLSPIHKAKWSTACRT